MLDAAVTATSAGEEQRLGRVFQQVNQKSAEGPSVEASGERSQRPAEAGPH
jgi:hypothetical protein